MLSSDVFQANVVLVQGGDFRLQIAAQQAHQEIDFAARTLLPVLFGKGIQRQPGNSDAGRSFDGGTYGCNSGAMSGHARQVPAARPAAVAVHDDGDVFREPFRIKLSVNFRFLAIQPGRNRRLQANLCCFKKLTQGGGGCNKVPVSLWSGCPRPPGVLNLSSQKHEPPRTRRSTKVSASMPSFRVFLRETSCPWWFMLLEVDLDTRVLDTRHAFGLFSRA